MHQGKSGGSFCHFFIILLFLAGGGGTGCGGVDPCLVQGHEWLATNLFPFCTGCCSSSIAYLVLTVGSVLIAGKPPRVEK